jgi:peptide/nickel transport system permease protein
MRSLPVFILTRVASVVVVVLTVAVVTFLTLHLLRPESWAFDQRSLAAQLWDYVAHLVRWDMGTSWDAQRRPVAEMVNAGLPADVSLLAGALVLGTVGGMAGGAVCATHPRTWYTRVLEWLAAFFLCAPVYWVGLMLILIFGDEFGVVPVPGFRTNVYAGLTEDPAAWLRALIVPWFVLAAPLAALCLRMTRASMTDVLGEDYLRTARAKGLALRTVTRRHALPSATSPVFTLVGVNMATLVTNVVLIEHAFSIPGVFRLTTQAMADGNFPLLQGMTVAAAVMVVVANLAVDVVQATIDPRVRLR